MVTPPINLTGVSTPQLKFWHTQALWSPDQDILTVYYKTSAGGAWTQLATYTTSVTTWTERTIALPNPSSSYYIAFEGNALYGRGVCVDDVSVSSQCVTTYPVSVAISASANPSCSGVAVNYTAVPTNGGTTPAYQWKVNGVNSGTNSATFSYSPVNADVVTCVLTSNLACATGSPATSNSITMSVSASVAASVSVSPSANPVCAGTSVTFTAVPTNGVQRLLISGR
ncbi:MAG: choice-of-anchor J domain-containing protein [Bacteroidales bacterium]|nr:choice-of-anchor J domain-containing protein [Bacteroidales bacterium]